VQAAVPGAVATVTVSTTTTTSVDDDKKGAKGSSVKKAKEVKDEPKAKDDKSSEYVQATPRVYA
jgi:hypothetical protein